MLKQTRTVRGCLNGTRRIDLDDEIDDVAGLEQIIVKLSAGDAWPSEDILDVLASLPPGMRTKKDIDAQLREERESWGEP